MCLSFRVPSSTIDRIRSEFLSWKAANEHAFVPRPRRLFGVVPVMTWGPQQQRKEWSNGQRVIGTTPTIVNYVWLFPEGGGEDERHCPGRWVIGDFFDQFGGHNIFATIPGGPDQQPYSFFTGGTIQDVDPGYIGVDCTGSRPRLSINVPFPLSNAADYVGALPTPASGGSASDPWIECFDLGPACDGEDGAPLYLEAGCIEPNSRGQANTSTTVYEGMAQVIIGNRPETFRLLPISSAGDYSGSNTFDDYAGIEVTPDHWHNLIFTADFTGRVSVTGRYSGAAGEQAEGGGVSSACRIGIAFDDKVYTKKEMSFYWPDGGGPNDIISDSALYVRNYGTGSGTFGPTKNCQGGTTTTHFVQVRPQYDLRPTNVPFADGPIGFPAAAEYSSAIKRVEEGEFFMFTDEWFDVNKDKNRRIFITEKGKPAPTHLAEEFFGRKPEVKLHGARNWQIGKNTGTYGGDAEEDAEFVGSAVGDIERYKPDPNLYGDQGEVS